MVGGRVMNIVSILSTAGALEAAIGVRASPTKVLKNQSAVQRMRYSNSGNFDK